MGPEFVYEALRVDPVAQPLAAGRRLRFLANVDPVDVARATGEGSPDAFDPETSLVIIVSKTFTTAETILNAKTIRDWLLRAMPSVAAAHVIRQHMVAVRFEYVSKQVVNNCIDSPSLTCLLFQYCGR